MSDAFYINRGELRHNLSRLSTALQKLSSSPGSTESEATYAAQLQNTVKLITEVEHQMKDLADTFAIQSSNAKKLGLSFDELALRKDIVETHQRAFNTMKDDFAYRVKGDGGTHGNSAVIVNELWSQRQTSQRRYEVETKENGGSVQFIHEKPLRQAEPSRESMHEMKQQLEDDDDDLVDAYERKVAGTHQPDPETKRQNDGSKGTTIANNRRNPGVVSEWMTHHFPLTERRNRVIFFSFPVFLILIIAIIILAVTLS